MKKVFKENKKKKKNGKAGKPTKNPFDLLGWLLVAMSVVFTVGVIWCLIMVILHPDSLNF